MLANSVLFTLLAACISSSSVPRGEILGIPGCCTAAAVGPLTHRQFAQPQRWDSNALSLIKYISGVDYTDTIPSYKNDTYFGESNHLDNFQPRNRPHSPSRIGDEEHSLKQQHSATAAVPHACVVRMHCGRLGMWSNSSAVVLAGAYAACTHMLTLLAFFPESAKISKFADQRAGKYC